MSSLSFSKGEAFIDLQPAQPTAGGTLHVTGQADTHNTNEAKLQKRVPQGINSSILLLEIIELDFIPKDNPQEVSYAENLDKTDQYSTIEIFVEGKKVASIDDIKLVH